MAIASCHGQMQSAEMALHRDYVWFTLSRVKLDVLAIHLKDLIEDQTLHRFMKMVDWWLRFHPVVFGSDNKPKLYEKGYKLMKPRMEGQKPCTHACVQDTNAIVQSSTNSVMNKGMPKIAEAK